MDNNLDLTFKTIDQKSFKLQFSPTSTVLEVKRAIVEARPDEDFEVERQKLIYNGKILEDEQILSDVNVDPKKYVVVMVSRKKAEPVIEATQSEVAKSWESKAEAVSSTAATVASSSSGSESTPGPTVNKPSETDIPAEHEKTVENICNMGYERSAVIRALRAAFYNADRAVEYLCMGIPDTNAAEALEEAPADAQSAEEESDSLNFLRNSPQFAQICQLVRGNPQMLPQIISEIASQNPELMQAIRENQAAFVEMLNSGATENLSMEDNVAPGAPPHESGHLSIPITENDRQAIQRLQSMGFPEQIVIEAYFACDKNEDLAVNYILSRMESDD